MQLIRQPNPKLVKPQSPEDQVDQKKKSELIRALLNNRISVDDLTWLREKITPEDLSTIIQRIYDMNESIS